MDVSMKKTLNLIIIFIVFLLLYFIQSNFFTWFRIIGTKPNLFIILTVFLGLFLSKKYSFTISITLGLLLDLFIGKMIGMNAIILGIASLIGNKCGESFSKESRITIMLTTMASTLICETVSYILQIIILNMEISILHFIQIILVEIMYNAIIIIIIYPILKKAGIVLEQNFETNKFMKYF